MASPTSFQLLTLGRLALLSSGMEDPAVNTRRRQLAVLAVLALSPRPLGRDALVDMFWGEEDEERARHSLSNALSHLRRVLGPGAIAARSAEIALAAEAGLTVDALLFQSACAAGEHARAVALYQGPFLDGVYVERSPRFEQWSGRERGRLERLFRESCAVECRRLAAEGAWPECVALATRWAEAAGGSAPSLLALVHAGLGATAEVSAAALADYRRLTADPEAPPDPRVQEAAARLAARVARDEAAVAVFTLPLPTDPARTVPEILGRSESGLTTAVASPARGTAAHPPVPVSPIPLPALPPTPPLDAPSPARRSPWRRGRWLLPVVPAALLTVLGIAAARRAAATRTHGRPVIAVIAIRNVRADTAAAWLDEGLKQMVTADLSRSPAVEVVAPDRVRDLAARGQFGEAHPLTADEALEMAARLGATWALTGGVSHGAGTYVVDATLRDVASGKALRTFTVQGATPMEVADGLAAHVLADADVGDGPHLGDVETASTGAYEHFVRADQAASEGRFAERDRELDLAIAADSNFVSAIAARLRGTGDPRLIARLARLWRRAEPRASEWDRLDHAVYAAFRNGEHARAEQLARALVARYPHDPRAYQELADILATHGRWSAADSVLQQALALDSLATLAGNGPCAACTAYGGLVGIRGAVDLAGAERAARRWIELQPELPAAWTALAEVLSNQGKLAAAVEAERRAAAFGVGDPLYAERVATLLVMARRYAAADSAAAAAVVMMPADRRSVELQEIRSLIRRERGEFRADLDAWRALAATDSSATRGPVYADELARTGDLAGAGRLLEDIHRLPVPTDPGTASLVSDRVGDWARAWSWHHALLADFIARAGGDTVRVHAIADTLDRIAPRSYYGRDWRLPHHLRGLLAERRGDWVAAEREFQAARWGVAGWTRTVAELAVCQLRLGRPADAVATLRQAYEGPLDAMGRYETRTELDLLMARAMAAAGQPDSARLYAGYVRAAWAHADPPVRARLAELP